MKKNRLEDLRDHLFETLEALRDEAQPMDVDRARAVAEVARTIIESAKAELRYIEITGKELETQLMSQPRPALVGRREG